MSKKTTIAIVPLALVLVLGLIGCVSSTPGPVPTPTVTPTLPAISTPTPTPPQAPSPKLTPAPTPIPVPTGTLAPVRTTTTTPGGAQAKSGDTVKVDYTGKLSDGTIFDTSVGKQPLEFTLGKNQVVVGFEKAVTGMKVGESKTVTIPANEAYGQRRDDLIIVVDRSQLPPGTDPQVGLRLQGTDPSGRLIGFTIIKVDEKTATLDANPPLAGKDLTFEIKLVEIKSK